MIEKGHWAPIFLAIIAAVVTLVEGGLIAMFILCAFIWYEVGWGILFVMAIIFWPLLCLLIRKHKEVSDASSTS